MRALVAVLAAALAALAALALVWRRAMGRLLARRDEVHGAQLARLQARLDRAEKRFGDNKKNEL